ncbi:Peptidase S33 tripeptidyl aminopeptidase-lik [Akanthomyces lecanii RCEF 1005]|uniref:Peptidase S33 tripeptidyl aminopeptidase-lik n=1 Tax=Akanthomyces lecanii RCEF 1005 TaxID=1081108 RepID=A0A168HBQ9_CORDF|nr:Peptidase S33 tripeptidyl aminopeptidase-lik [Akanthomyces lecanii RCEF 1005]
MLFRAASAAALAATATASLSTYEPVRRSPADFDWATLTPSWSLHFSPCYDEYECARLLVPVDWTGADAEHNNSTRTMAIALTRLRADMTGSEEAAHGGTVIVNPGGPGDSGVVDMLVNGHYLRDLVATDATRFDVLSFDPRGMAFSTPAMDCFAGSDAAGRALFAAETAGVDAASVSGDNRDEVLTPKRALLNAYGSKCDGAGEDGYAMARYVGTTSVARDVLRVVDELERLRAREETGAEVEERPRLQYFGTSYGTMLGNTFVSMFPGRVKRMVLDGNVVPEDYTAADWSGNMVDIGKVVDNFYNVCFAAQSACALYDAEVDTSPGSIRAKVDALAANLTAKPAIISSTGAVPSILKGSSVRSLFLGPLYAPLGPTFPMLASTLAAAVAGNYTPLAIALQIPAAGLCADAASHPAKYTWQPEAGTAVRCGDGADVRNTTNDEWRATLDAVQGSAPDWWVDFWMGAQLQCREWPARPHWRFAGPFGSPAADPSGRSEDRPSAPVLFLGSRYDPATPLRNAKRAARKHKGARVVVLNEHGHCATLSGPSACVKDIVGRYMATGEMPEEGTECEPACKPFEECPYLRMILPW